MIIVSTPQTTGIGPTALGGAGANKSIPIPTTVAQTLIRVGTPVMSADGYTALPTGDGGSGGGSTSALPSWWKGAAVVAALGVGYVVLKRRRAAAP